MTIARPLPNRRRKANSSPSSTQPDAPGDDSAAPHRHSLHGRYALGTLFYETPQDLLDTAVCYFEARLRSNELCVWAVSDPISLQQAEVALRRAIQDFDCYHAAGQIELLAGSEWYLNGYDLQRITGGWNETLNAALAKGYDGVRRAEMRSGRERNTGMSSASTNMSLIDLSPVMIVLCTYSLHASRTVDMLHVARAHQCAITLRNGN